ncbi:hypothetical protein BJV78DRAFT_1282419 [Lactifluus subvellereus]|nr:hypothetical protein BJV78DRAFT_1282419 [Lactifluus subvellereus]
MSPPPTPLSETLVDAPRHTDRPSINLKLSSSISNIVTATVVDAAGQSLYSISSNSKRTTLLSCENSAEVATVNWDRSNPRMVFRGKKMKCKEWLPLAGLDTESRILTHGDAQFTWMQRSTSGYLIPANKPGLAVAKWRTKWRTDELHLEIFKEAPVEAGLLEAIVLSVVLLRSGRSLGDSFEATTSTNQRFFPDSYMMGTH